MRKHQHNDVPSSCVVSAKSSMKLGDTAACSCVWTLDTTPLSRCLNWWTRFRFPANKPRFLKEGLLKQFQLLQCLPWSVACLPVLHLIVDSVEIYHSLWLEQEISTLNVTLWSTSLTWFSLTMRMRLRTVKSSGIAHSSNWGDQFFFATRCFGRIGIMPSSSWLVYLDVIGTGYINLMVWMFHLDIELYYFEAMYWLFLLRSELVIAVDDTLQRNNCIELNLHWGCWIEHSILHRGLKMRDAISMWQADLRMEHYVSEEVYLHVNVLRHTLSLFLFVRS